MKPDVPQETVAMVACGDYGPQLAVALERALSLLTWSTSVVLAGKRVLLKPNLLTDRAPDQAVTTHPEFVRQVIRWFKTRGAVVTVGDSPANTVNLKQVWRMSGMEDVCAEEEVPLISFEHGGVRNSEMEGFRFPVAQSVLDADLIVNLPKVKSHSLTGLTAAVKNIYGIVPGYSKTSLHRQYPKTAMFGRLVATLWRVVPPSLTIADGVVGMEGQGPANGRPIRLGFMAASENPFALDRAICDVLGLDVRRVPYLAGCEGTSYRRVGDPVAVDAFEVPSGAHLLNVLPERLLRLAGRWIWVRPSFCSHACIRCGQCERACPVQAIRSAALTQGPVLEGATCIGCSCCHEVCPAGAIRMKQSSVLRWLNVFKGIE